MHKSLIYSLRRQEIEDMIPMFYSDGARSKMELVMAEYAAMVKTEIKLENRKFKDEMKRRKLLYGKRQKEIEIPTPEENGS